MDSSCREGASPLVLPAAPGWAPLLSRRRALTWLFAITEGTITAMIMSRREECRTKAATSRPAMRETLSRGAQASVLELKDGAHIPSHIVELIRRDKLCTAQYRMYLSIIYFGNIWKPTVQAAEQPSS